MIIGNIKFSIGRPVCQPPDTSGRSASLSSGSGLRGLLLTVLLCFGAELYGQPSGLVDCPEDSSVGVSEAIDNAYSKSRELRLKDAEQAWDTIHAVKPLLQQASCRDLGRWHYRVSTVVATLGRQQQSIEFAVQAAGYAGKANDYYRQARSLYRKAKAERRLGRLSDSLMTLDKMLNVVFVQSWEDPEDPLYLEATVYTGMGDVFNASGDYVAAAEKWLQAAEIYERLGWEERLTDLYSTVGAAYCQVGSCEKALLHYQKSLQFSQQHGDDYNIALGLSNIAYAHHQLEQFEKAESSLDQALAHAQKSNGKRAMAHVHRDYGFLFRDTGQKDKSIAHFMESERIYREMSDPIGQNTVRAELAMLRFELGDQEEAAAIINQVVSDAERQNFRDVLVSGLDYAAKIAAGQGRYQDAYDYGEKEAQLRREDQREQLVLALSVQEAQLDLKALRSENRQLEDQVHTAETQGERKDQAIRLLLVLGVVLAGFGIALILVIRKLRYVANHDELTGALNRRRFFELVNPEARANPRGKCALLLIDIDGFKAINDNFGHAMGDVALQKISAVVAQGLPGNCRFCRMGGDEFLIFLADGSAEQAIEVAQHLLDRLAQSDLDMVQGVSSISASIGIAEKRANNERLDSMISRADHAMYAAKAVGGGCYKVSLV